MASCAICNASSSVFPAKIAFFTALAPTSNAICLALLSFRRDLFLSSSFDLSMSPPG
jgi:hypothetical protein